MSQAPEDLIKVTHSALAKAVADANAASSYMNSQFSRLKEECNRLGVWDGPNARAYKALQTEWDEAAEAMRQVLLRIATTVEQINAGDKKRESEREARWRSRM
jgi:WXG100 family type VII secretion target